MTKKASQIRASQIRASQISSNHRELHGAIFCFKRAIPRFDFSQPMLLPCMQLETICLLRQIERGPWSLNNAQNEQPKVQNEPRLCEIERAHPSSQFRSTQPESEHKAPPDAAQTRLTLFTGYLYPLSKASISQARCTAHAPCNIGAGTRR